MFRSIRFYMPFCFCSATRPLQRRGGARPPGRVRAGGLGGTQAILSPLLDYARERVLGCPGHGETRPAGREQAFFLGGGWLLWGPTASTRDSPPPALSQRDICLHELRGRFLPSLVRRCEESGLEFVRRSAAWPFRSAPGMMVAIAQPVGAWAPRALPE